MTYDVELIGVGKTYDNGSPAVIDFDLNVQKGEFIAFLGPSGCGKTTTLRMIAGFETITSGDIFIKGKRINDLPPERRPTSMIFQNYALFPHMTVRRNVGYGLDVKGMPRIERDAKVERILATLGLTDIADQKPDRLSGGQRQRIALARGLVVEPDILLLDEPLGALDANLRKAIQAELKLLQVNLGITFIFVTHAQSEALTMSDRIVVMNNGRIEQISSPRDLYTRPGSRFVAQFIGRNTILSGSLQGVENGRGQVQTTFGRFSGVMNKPVVPGAQASLVVPAEAFTMNAVSAGLAVSKSERGNVLQATIESRDMVGPIVRFLLAIEGGQSVALEGHVERYGQGFPTGSSVHVSWDAAKATIIPAAA
ncbi:ABC transporter ATP-binding protein [Lichenihabitans sp. PAMC28606]|uniref:ABC transporter ATP-binding protein n=1 Tax=Lichenihabitans sp. PAMC28606 TaxID=2880932 RepID=UPI001D0AA442|nr:ABC transporter ATP-binding protein [Lichenihabitans sp. PAMC28606]UDL93906.1 ABC transporter ATP-binding protein [Lichenihabitans sp. PAMC28606]